MRHESTEYSGAVRERVAPRQGRTDAAGHAAPSLRRRVFAAERLLFQKMLESLGDPQVRVELWDGQEIGAGGTGPRVRIHDRGALLKLIADPELQFGEMYSAGRIDVEGDLPHFLEVVYRAMRRSKRGSTAQRRLSRFQDSQRNSVPRARRNIHHHYDISNDFYRLWLDDLMVYTCAYFEDPAVTLEQAQIAKLDHVCRKLRLQPGDTVVEAGCGWGALALHMAKHYGASVRAYNISKEQIAYAREQARMKGLEGRVQFIDDDYRTASMKCDAFVSVGMLEHVGPERYRELGEVMNRCVKDDGRGLIHTIGRDHPGVMNPWIERNIFPGACPPSLSQMMQLFEPFGFSVLDVENLRLHYAKTLEHWLQRYELQTERIGAIFEANFVRTWRLYLAGSLAAFRAGDLQLFQVSFARAGSNRVPWTRRYLYEAAGAPQDHAGI